ncbi:MAG: hypothetical protein IIB40_10880 [Candidatus Marinimicrobia bacterium]|nr:hypothetical protein [Candidatus Neomarinimicrobiota bacterium]
MTKKDIKLMARLAQEGKQISDIWREYFPNLGYWDVYIEVHGEGQRSSRGIKQMISARLIKIVDATKPQRKIIVNELNELVWHLYLNHKQNQTKIDKIRKALD